ncbi:MAG: bacterioferritin-associated ferredoxin [bacterium ADurb.BinA186]|nr:MAG: bacterioferritin-associated ferredoxin [bacterium ADurb.BinA186]
MIICLCQNVSDRTVNGLIEQGLTTVKAMQKKCSIGRGCGKCVCLVKELLGKHSGLLTVQGCVRSALQTNEGAENGLGKKGNYCATK